MMLTLRASYDAWLNKAMGPDVNSRPTLAKERIFIHEPVRGWFPVDADERYDGRYLELLNSIVTMEAARGWGKWNARAALAAETESELERDFGKIQAGEGLRFYSVFFDFIRSVLQDKTACVAEGFVEPRQAARELISIDPGWWDDRVKVDFNEAKLWAADGGADSWRLIFSDIVVSRSFVLSPVAPYRRRHLAKLIETVADANPRARALKGNTATPRHGEIEKIIQELLADPRLHGEKPTAVRREFDRTYRASDNR